MQFNRRRHARRRRNIKEKENSSSSKRFFSKKKVICLGILVVALIGVGVGFFIQRMSTPDEIIPVSSVSAIMGLGSGSGVQNRFAGVVESQKSWTAKKDPSRDIKKVYVKEGDKVEIGDPLFEYDESSMSEQLAQAKIELQQYDIDIADLKNQVKELENEKKTAASADRLSYTIQIQSAQNDIKKNEYEKKQKEKEISEMEKNKGETKIVSELAGVVTKLYSYSNSSSGSDEDMEMEDGGSGSGEEVLTITGIGNYRVKCKINEQNYSDIKDGDKMIVHSRVDENLYWSGEVTSMDQGESKLDKDEASEEASETDSDDMTSSTSYTFYVNLDSSDNLLLGQHVYVEIDNGQTAVQEGIWLDEAYISDIDSSPYVWADDGSGRIKKKYIEVGVFNDELFQYEIIAGLTIDDKIAYPDETYKEGMKTEDEALEDESDSEEFGSDSPEDEFEEDLEDFDMEESDVEPEVMTEEGEE